MKIAGSGPQKTELENYAKAGNLKNVEFLGHKSDNDLRNLISQSRLVVLPAIWYENNPISVLEAFAAAKPVVASNLGGLPELVKNNEFGFIFKAGDSDGLANIIKANYDNTEAIKKMGANGRKFVEINCFPTSHLANILRIYSKLINKQ